MGMKRGIVVSAPYSIRSSTFLTKCHKTIYASVKAYYVVRRDGVNKGKIERIELTNPGSGYTEEEVIQVTVSPPQVDPTKLSGNSTVAGQTFVAKAVLEYEVGEIEITSPGGGYATEKPLEVIVDHPSDSEAFNLDRL